MPKGFKINKRGVREMTRELEKEIARNPVRVPIESFPEEMPSVLEPSYAPEGLGFDRAPEGTVPRQAAVEATLVLLLELEEQGLDERGVDPSRQWIDQHLHLLDEPVRTWAQEHVRELTRALTRDHLLANKHGSLGGQVGSELSERGRRYAVHLRAQRSGRSRLAAVSKRVLGLIGHADFEGWQRVEPADLTRTVSAWVSGVKVTEDETNRAGRDLILRDLIEVTELGQGAACSARLTPNGFTVLEAFNGSIGLWEKSKAQGGTRVGDQITIRDSNGVQVATRTSGTVNQSASTEVSMAPDLAQVCAQIRELVPDLSLDASERQELLEQTERLEGASENPEKQVRGVKRWLSTARDLLEGDTSGKAARVLSLLMSALAWCDQLLGRA